MTEISAGMVARLWMESQPSVLSFICAAIPRFHDAEDVLQEVAVEVAENAAKYDPHRPFVAWALGIARFKVAAHYRQQKRNRCLLTEENLALLADAHVRRHEDIDERRQALEDCLDQLAPKAREMVQLRYCQGLGSSALAKKLDSTSGSVRVALTRIRTRLLDCVRRKLSAAGVV